MTINKKDILNVLVPVLERETVFALVFGSITGEAFSESSDIDLAVYLKDPALFAVMDGTTAGSGPGPRTVQPHEKSVLLASSDMVAIDAVAARIMGFDPMQIRCLAKAHELGLGVADPREIEVVCQPEVARENWNFNVGANFATGAGKIFWNSPLRMLQ